MGLKRNVRPHEAGHVSGALCVPVETVAVIPDPQGSQPRRGEDACEA